MAQTNSRPELAADYTFLKLLTYALGRAPELADRAVLDGILKDLSSNKRGFKDLIRAVVLSEPFRRN